MVLTVICIGIAGWVIFMGARFYSRADWDEPAESSPDFGAMHKKEAQLEHVQETLQEAVESGKLSKNALDEFARYADHERAEMKAIEKAWRERKSSV